MKKMMNWVLAATLVCGAIVFTSCSSHDDNPAGPDAGTPAIAMIGKIGHVDYFKQIESAFGMARKAVEAVLAGAKQGEMVPTFYVTRDNLNDDAVKPFLEFYQIDAPAIDNLGNLYR